MLLSSRGFPQAVKLRKGRRDRGGRVASLNLALSFFFSFKCAES